MPRIPLFAVLLVFVATTSSWSEESFSVLEPTSTSDNWIAESGMGTEAGSIVEQPIYMNGSDAQYEVISTHEHSSGSWWSPLSSIKQRLFGSSESQVIYSNDYSMGEEMMTSTPDGKMMPTSPIQFVDEETGTTFIVGADGVARPASPSMDANQQSPSHLSQQTVPYSTPRLTRDPPQHSAIPDTEPYTPWYARLNPFRGRSHEVSRSEAWASPTTTLTASHSTQFSPPTNRPATYAGSKPTSYNVAVTAKDTPSNVKHTQPSYGYSRMPSYQGAQSIAKTTPKSSEIRPSYQASWSNQPQVTTGGVRRSTSFDGLDSYSDKAVSTASRPIFTNGRFAR